MVFRIVTADLDDGRMDQINQVIVMMSFNVFGGTQVNDIVQTVIFIGKDPFFIREAVQTGSEPYGSRGNGIEGVQALSVTGRIADAGVGVELPQKSS